MKIELNLSKNIFMPKFYEDLFDYSKRIQIFMGSAGSGKSYFITQKLIIKSLNSNRKTIVARRYGNSNRHSTFALFKVILKDLKLINYCKIRESDMNIRLPNGSEFIFLGLDNEEKLLSLTNISDIFIEEIFEIGKDMFDQLNFRLRGRGISPQIYGAFNPISKHHWLYEYCEVSPPPSLRFLKSTYKDNPFLDKSYIDAIDELESQNPQKYRIYGLGEWGVDNEGLVFKNWVIGDFDSMELAKLGYEHRVGMDLGYVDPSTIVSTLYDRENKSIYIYEDYYQTGAQLDEIKEALKERNLTKTKVYCDSAEPRSIAYFRQFGFNVVASKKGKGSVNTGIAFIQDHKLFIHPSCGEIIREIENYSYIKDKHTGEFNNDTTHEFSHTLDALRYAYSDIYTSNKVTTLNKSVLGL